MVAGISSASKDVKHYINPEIVQEQVNNAAAMLEEQLSELPLPVKRDMVRDFNQGLQKEAAKLLTGAKKAQGAGMTR